MVVMAKLFACGGMLPFVGDLIVRERTLVVNQVNVVFHNVRLSLSMPMPMVAIVPLVQY